VHFLVIVASERRNGNSDLLGRLAVRHALKAGADSGEVIYLKNFEIEQCRGCLNCISKKQRCHIDDDLYQFLDIVKEADRMLLVAPVYVLTVPGKLKMLLDRYLAISSYLEIEDKGPAVSIGVAALPDWHQLQLPLMNIFLLSLGRRVVDSSVVYGAGPGEVLLTDGIRDLQVAVERLVNYQDKQYESQLRKSCPIDFSTSFEHIEGQQYRCPICLTPAKLTKEGYYFDAADLNNHRWTEKKLQDHFENWIKQTKPRFKSMLKQIMAKKKELGLV
jgi:multimeric flavodoxin WrbA